MIDNKLPKPKHDFSTTTDHDLKIRKLTLQLELLAIETEERDRDRRRQIVDKHVDKLKTISNINRNNLNEAICLNIQDVDENHITIGQKVDVFSKTRSRSAPFYGVTQATVTGLDHRNWVKLEASKQTSCRDITVRSVQIPGNIRVNKEQGDT